ncbi:hypothetical protein H9I45_01285 [Polaribacter haliotis]|uniref:Uncharacterized protein n=1 Tax=Polaribacter haliotis TaxID=1888915 RepID=A0A7L8AGN7_9FLAO|nr:hypothetical protein [Polaribacter haliotis]QOD59366.1 hypothetical protein H9I45_08240 [Polaribacter haliotis]QOD61104.1 hypothetical protein H9I45_01285 [Polaribacter haliotis]
MKQSKISKTWNYYKKNSWKLGVLILSIVLFYFVIQKIELKQNSVETYGKIYEKKRIVSGIRVGPLFKYKFWFMYNGKKHFGETTKTLEGENNIGKVFKVRVLMNKPENYEILFDQEYVEKYIIDKNGIKKTLYFEKN